MEGSFGVRKGAWTEEEDILVKQCIQKYSEGKWHLGRSACSLGCVGSDWLLVSILLHSGRPEALILLLRARH